MLVVGVVEGFQIDRRSSRSNFGNEEYRIVSGMCEMLNS
jgi:hypothetical protein